MSTIWHSFCSLSDILIIKAMKAKTVTYAVTMIIALLLITTTDAFVSNVKSKRKYNKEKLMNESVIKENQQVSQELDKMKNDLSALTAAKESAEKELTTTRAGLAEAEKRIESISKENNSLLKDRSELNQLEKSKISLSRAFEDLKLKQETASARIEELENSVIVLDTQLSEFTGKLANADIYKPYITER